ncbi:proton-conducting transporter transmembrane domain-containing protein [Cysteiniphilum halobium]|uniref:proton-conducting transporter transmembrane domain-containing protein n=1 Tax=Cysteiniphilum halobium TaxID=2219059 RepID=UPI003F849B82
MILLFFLLLVLAAVGPVLCDSFYKKSYLLTYLIFAVLIGLSLYLLLFDDHTHHFSYAVIAYKTISVVFFIGLDHLAKVLLLFVLTIGFLIYCYANNYLSSDQTRLRFLLQLISVISSVCLLVVAQNLFTAFVAWQFIGITLYIILNHYHYDIYANKAAKKKFVINRIGDCSFIMAIVISYCWNMPASFDSLVSNTHSWIIATLLCVSVLTKCAQFPFHIWLIDTMETPTPVSALMHAGVINAGAILLARVGHILINEIVVLIIVFCLSLMSIVLSAIWGYYQTDIKKKLAYSTMGQMGYMLAQCSLGAFPAAIFHFIAHGFYKAYLFLSAGEINQRNQSNGLVKADSIYQFSKYLCYTVLLFIISYWLMSQVGLSLPVFIEGFIFITLLSISRAIVLHIGVFYQRLIACIAVLVMVLIYLMLLSAFTHFLQAYEFTTTISVWIQVVIIIGFVVMQCLLWLKPQLIEAIKTRDMTEQYWRVCILNPFRWMGSFLNHMLSRHSAYLKIKVTGICYIVLFVLVLNYFSITGANTWLSMVLFLPIILILIASNRSFSLKQFVIYLTLFEGFFICFVIYFGNVEMTKIGVFHMINITLTILMLFSLILSNNKSPKTDLSELESNKLPSRFFYLIFALLMLVGIPGTSSFVSEFMILNIMFSEGYYIACILVLSIIVLLSITIMHAIQLYVFNLNYTEFHYAKVRVYQHIFFITVVLINIFSGIAPNILIQHI